MWLMSDIETIAFIAIVLSMTALAVWGGNPGGGEKG
jgi:hypothetical protein